MALIKVIILFCGVVTVATGLECYQCTDTTASIFKNEVSSNSECKSPNLAGDIETVECQPGDSCVFITGTIGFLGITSTQMSVRGCAPLGQNDISGCVKADNDNVPLSLFAKSLDSIDGEICYCNTDLCVAQSCDNGFVILSACVKYWYLGLSFGLLLLCIIGCCCCCCRMCCRSKSGTVIRQPLIYSQAPTAGVHA